MRRLVRRSLVGDVDALHDAKTSGLVLPGTFLAAFAVTAFIQFDDILPVSPLAVLVGIGICAWFGYRARGLAFAWSGAFAAITGHVFRNALLDPVFETVDGRIEYLGGALLYAVVLAAIVGVLGYAAGWLLHAGIRNGSTTSGL